MLPPGYDSGVGIFGVGLGASLLVQVRPGAYWGDLGLPPANQPPQPYHPYCATGPSGGHSAGIFLCQDTDANNLVTNNNKILNNSTSSYYGILSVGADELKAYWARATTPSAATTSSARRWAAPTTSSRASG